LTILCQGLNCDGQQYQQMNNYLSPKIWEHKQWHNI